MVIVKTSHKSARTKRILDNRNKYLSIAGAAMAILAIAIIGIELTFGSHAATPFASLEAEAGSLTNGATALQDATASGGSAVRFGSTTTPPPPPPPPGGVPDAGSYVKPGTVGYLGSTSALTQYFHGGAAPSGCSWQTYGLRCDSDLTLDHVWVKGGIYWNGTGNLKITNSIIEGGDAWYVVYSSNDAANKMTVYDSTLTWPSGQAFPGGYDVAPVWQRGSPVLDIQRNDISVLPQGLNPTANSTIIGNWIHNMKQNGCGSGPCHMDGIFSQGGSNILIQQNYVDAPTGTDVTAGVFFQNLGGSNTGVKVYANFIKGGAYYNLRNETSVGLDVRNNTFGSNQNAWNQSPGTIGTWTGNVHLDGSAVPKP